MTELNSNNFIDSNALYSDLDSFYCYKSKIYGEAFDFSPLTDLDKALFMACCDLNLEKVQTALAQGANANAQINVKAEYLNESYLHTPLTVTTVDYAKGYHLDHNIQSLKISEVLLNAGANPDGADQDSHPLLEAADRQNLPLVELLLNYGADVNARDSIGYTALHTASGGYGAPISPNIIELLVETGVDINHQSEFGDTAAHLVARHNDYTESLKADKIKSLTILKTAGADFEIINQGDKTVNDLIKSKPYLDEIFNNKISEEDVLSTHSEILMPDDIFQIDNNSVPSPQMSPMNSPINWHFTELISIVE